MSPRGRLLAFTAFAVPAGSIIEPKAFLVVLAPILIIALLWLGRREGRALPHFPWGAAWLAAAILIWAGLSAMWSLDPGNSLKKFGDLVLVAGGALLLFGTARHLTPRDGQVIGLALTLGVILALLAQWSERATGGALVQLFHADTAGPLSPLVRGISIAAVLVWAAVIYLYRTGSPRLALTLGLAALATFWIAEGTAAAVSISIGAILCTGFFALPRKAVSWLAVIAAIWVLLVPLAMKGAVAVIPLEKFQGRSEMLSAYHRLQIWNFASDKILERPVLGFGLRAARKVPGGEQTFTFNRPGRPVELPVFAMHPHNGPLEWWLELGLPGAAFGAVVVFLLFRWARRVRDRWTRALVLGQLVTAFGILNLSFGVWQIWWLTALVLMAYLTVTVLECAERADLPRFAGAARRTKAPAA